jgi:hypothetical protein
MIQPATKPASTTPEPSRPAEQAAGPSSLAAAVASEALKRQQEEKATDPEKKWNEMGGELYAALEGKDRATFTRLLRPYVRLAVSEALRGNKR